MNGIMKALTAILGIMAVAACLATVGVIGYSLTGAGNNQEQQTVQTEVNATPETSGVPAAAPEATASPETDAAQESEEPRPVIQTGTLTDHVHDYEESVDQKATCYRSGRLKYTCSCGDFYYVDVASTGHVADDWELIRKPAADQEGLRVKKCIYCDDIVASETVPFEENTGSSDKNEEPPHVHQYTASIEREPSCILAGLRKYTCSCGSFYTEMIPAPGHIATDWTVAEEPTTTYLGREQRTCSVCGVLLDSRPINRLTSSPSASAGNGTNNGNAANATASATARATASATATATAGANATARATATAGSGTNSSASPSASAHAHSYRSYVLKEANCTEKGIRSFVCSCGSSYAEEIERNLENHSYRAVVIPATGSTNGYTIYTCIRCNHSYYDNYSPALSLQ